MGGTPSIGTTVKVLVWGQRALADTITVPGRCCFPFHPVSMRGGDVPAVLPCSLV